MKLCKRIVTVTVILTGFMICHFSQAQSANTITANKAADVKVATLLLNDDNATPNIDSTVAQKYQCELNDSLTLYTNPNDDTHAVISWKSKLYPLTRVETTTGADRFENKQAGLVWIGIPTKSMLMDSIRGEQLTNECKAAQQ